MKKAFSFLVAFSFFCVSQVFAAQGILWGEKNIKVAKTQWFDIIYPEACFESAQVLYENADSIYESLSEMYNTPIPCRLPVVLTSKVEMYNAYWTNSYYNRIVLYVAPPMDECNVESDNVLKTFKHELTHAFTYNMKTPFYKWMGNVFGDAVNVCYWNVTSGLSEGATLTSESVDGEGRLNDEFAKQSVKQAKIEGKFPAFNDVQGSRDAYPSNTFYFFNGAFHEWLQEKYGFEPYVDWWINCVNLKALTIRRAFFKAYNQKLIACWKQFVSEYEVPTIEPNPVKAGIVQDFYNKVGNDYSISNNDGGLPVSLSVSKKGLTYLLDNRSSVYFVPSESILSETVKPKKLFINYYTETARQSSDGRFIALTTYKSKNPTIHYETQIYDTEHKSLFTIKEKGLKDGAIIQSEGKYYLVALKFVAEDYKIRISEIEFKNEKLSGEKDPVYIPYTRTQLPASFVDCGNGIFAFALKDKMEYSLCFANLKGEIVNQVQVPFERMVVRYLSYVEPENALIFSWTKPGSMPRSGKLLLNDFSFALSDEDISGGVYYPVKVEDKIVYIGQFYTSNRLLIMEDFETPEKMMAEFTEETKGTDELSETAEAAALDTEDIPAAEEEQEFIYEMKNLPKPIVDYPRTIGTDELLEDAHNVKKEKKYNSEFEKASQKYKGATYYKKGMLLPYSEVVAKSYASGCSDFRLPFGITYLTGDPFDSHNLDFSIGYGYLTNSAGMNLGFNGGTDTGIFRYNVNANCEVDRYGWKNAELTLKESSYFDVGRISEFGLSPISTTWVGRRSASEQEKEAKYSENSRLYKTNSQVFLIFGNPIGAYECLDMTNYLFNREQLLMYYSNIHRVQNNSMSKLGIQVGMVPYFIYSRKLDGSKEDLKTYDISFFALGYIPRLIPIKCYEGLTYNLPLKLTAGLFSANTVVDSLCYAYESFPTMGFVGGELVLFAAQIQKSISFLPFIYLNDVRITLDGFYGANYNTKTVSDNMRFLLLKKYCEEIAAGHFKPYGTIALKATLGAVPVNFGSFASSEGKVDAFISGTLVIKKDKTEPKFDFGTDIRF